MTPTATLAPVPNQPKTPMRSLRVSDEQWQLWHAAAEVEGMTLSDFIRAVMDRSARRAVKKERPASDSQSDSLRAEPDRTKRDDPER